MTPSRQKTRSRQKPLQIKVNEVEEAGRIRIRMINPRIVLASLFYNKSLKVLSAKKTFAHKIPAVKLAEESACEDLFA